MAQPSRNLTQAQRRLTISTPLGEDLFVVRRMEGQEALSRLFSFQLEMLSTDAAVDHNNLLGQSVTVRLDGQGDSERHFNGYVSRFSQHGYDGQYAHYRAEIVPWLWFLGRTSDCRIFQDKSVPEIVKEVFREHGFTDFEDALSGDYQSFACVTQYRETDLNFVSRLLEQEGIYYFFRHEEDQHILVLADGHAAHQVCEGCEEVPYYAASEDQIQGEVGHLWDWEMAQEVQPGMYALDDYDFTAPRKSLRAVASIEREHARGDFEVFDYPGGYHDSGYGESYSRIRIEERQAEYQVGRARGNVLGLSTGGLFTLTSHPRDDQNREYLVTQLVHRADSHHLDTEDNDGRDLLYRCELMVIDAKTPFRPQRVTPKPRVHGPQTAVVVGKPGEEIWTDEYGRVKVQFHWDRHGQADENSSCWVRVSQNWAGKNWGGMFMPHVGHEVLVSFLEGDPDRPIITGRVYNGDNMPPEDLPANDEKSVIKDKAGNHMIMTSTEGEEQVHMFSPYGDSKFWLGAPNDGEGAGCETDYDLNVSVARNWISDIGQDYRLHVLENRIEEIDGNEEKKVKGSAVHEYIKDVNENFFGNVKSWTQGFVDVSVDQPVWEMNGGLTNKTFVGAKFEESFSFERSINGLERVRRAKKGMEYEAGGKGASAMHLKPNKVAISCGKSEIIIKKDGKITVRAKDNIHIEAGSGKMVNIQGKEVRANSGKVVTKNIEDKG